MELTNWAYTDKVLDHFMHPKNILEDEKAYKEDGRGITGNIKCGDQMLVVIQVDTAKGVITDCKWKTFGCASAIASTSVLSEMVKGMKIEDAYKLSPKDITKELGGLPPNKLHCSNLGADALHKAIENYAAKKPEAGEKGCHCPYCDAPIEGSEICAPCKTQGRK